MEKGANHIPNFLLTAEAGSVSLGDSVPEGADKAPMVEPTITKGKKSEPEKTEGSGDYPVTVSP
jgi:molybdopterin biosynthesis enzyme